MEERLSVRRSDGFDRSVLRLWGLIIAAVGILGRGILQNRVLGMNTNTSAQLLELMNQSGAAMNAATAALAMQAIESMAVPIFAVLTVDGFAHTKSVKKYLLHVGAVAAVSEGLYNFALTGKFIENSTRNPVFGLVIVIAMLYLLRYYAGNDLTKVMIKAAVIAAAWVWAGILRVEFGRSMVLISAVLWILRGRHTMAFFTASAVALVCCVGSPLFMFAPMGFLLAHFYNGEEGNTVKLLQYALYPLILLLIGAVGILLF